MEDQPLKELGWVTLIALVISLAVYLIILPRIAHAEPAYSDCQIVNAIGRAENSKVHPYGIMKKYRATTPRQACFNSVRSARHRFSKQNKIKDFIYFLSLTYAPRFAQNDPGDLNRNWYANVKWLLSHEK
jgi:hypothetical protein